MRPFSLLLCAGLLAVPGLAGAQIYKCTGPNGVVQYSQSRSTGKCAEYNQAPAPRTGSDSGAVNRYLQQVDQEHAARSQQQAEAAKDAEFRKQACSVARGHAAVLGQSGRAFTTDENGNRRYLDEQQFDQQRQQANAAVDQFCN